MERFFLISSKAGSDPYRYLPLSGRSSLPRRSGYTLPDFGTSGDFYA